MSVQETHHPDRLLPLTVIVALATGIVIVCLLLFGVGTLASTRLGQVVLLVGVVASPVLLRLGGEARSMTCHEGREGTDVDAAITKAAELLNDSVADLGVTSRRS